MKKVCQLIFKKLKVTLYMSENKFYGIFLPHLSQKMGNDINASHLLDADISFDEVQLQSREINDKLAITCSEEDLLTSTIFNNELQHAYDLIL